MRPRRGHLVPPRRNVRRGVARAPSHLLATLALASCSEPPPAPPAAAIAAPGRPRSAGFWTETDAPPTPPAMPAWTAVIRRAEYLARRGATGAVQGIWGPSDGPYRWLVDPEEGDGSLAIRVALPVEVAAEEGASVVLWGAWHSGGAGNAWYWRATRGQRRPASAGQKAGSRRDRRPGHHIEDTAEVFPGAGLPSRLGPRDRAVVFYAVGTPVKLGDGWPIADAPGAAPSALLLLPGEREPYGAQNFLAADELWQLAPRIRYTVQLRGRRQLRGLALPVLFASHAPRRLTGPDNPP